MTPMGLRDLRPDFPGGPVVLGHLRKLPSPERRRELRRLCRVSYKTLAGFIGVTRQAVHQWEIGQCRPGCEKHADLWVQAYQGMEKEVADAAQRQ